MTKVVSLRRKKLNNIKPNISKNRNVKKFSELNTEKYKIMLLFVSIIGILLGSFCFRLTENSEISKIISENVNILNSGDFKSVFLYLLKLDLIFFLFSFFIGTSFIGSAISFLSPMLKCIYIGYFSGYLYNNFELKGVLFCLILMYPCFVITTTSLIFASNENVYMSQYIYKTITDKISTDNISVRLYLLRYFLLFVINTVSITVTSLLISFIGPKINMI